MEQFTALEQAFFKCQSKEAASILIRKYAGNQAMISLHDQQGIYLEASDSSNSFMNLAERELKETSAYDYFHPDDFQNILKSHAKVTVRPEVDQVDYRLKNGPNSYLKVETLSRRIVDKNGREYILALTFKRD